MCLPICGKATIKPLLKLLCECVTKSSHRTMWRDMYQSILCFQDQDDSERGHRSQCVGEINHYIFNKLQAWRYKRFISVEFISLISLYFIIITIPDPKQGVHHNQLANMRGFMIVGKHIYRLVYQRHTYILFQSAVCASAHIFDQYNSLLII